MKWMRPLGNTGMEVSALGLGTVKLGRDQNVRYPRAFSIPDERCKHSSLSLIIPMKQASPALSGVNRSLFFLKNNGTLEDEQFIQ